MRGFAILLWLVALAALSDSASWTGDHENRHHNYWTGVGFFLFGCLAWWVS